MLENITPLIITYNEAPNIARTLERLHWAHDIVIVDSFSDDETLDLAAAFPQVRIFQRRFDSFASQCNYGLTETGITSEWVLNLDADYLLTPELVEELKVLKPSADIVGYRARFIYCIYGRQLRGTVYPPVDILYRHEIATYKDDGHAHRVVLDGTVNTLRSPLLHDDWKPLNRWFQSQSKYMAIEANKLIDSEWSELNYVDRIRFMRLPAPFIMLLYCLIVKGALLDGWIGIYYAFQRTLAELLLSLHLIDHDLFQSRHEGK
jgi:glycosyltransferase involved in cell wall biosynthesis